MRLLLLFLSVLAAVNLPAQYKGGTDDGSATVLVSNLNKLANIYQGGSDDGFASAQVSGQNRMNNIYGGGTGDGFTTLLVTGQNQMANIYTGGTDDGFSFSLSTGQNLVNNIYRGGTDDGFAGIVVAGLNTLNNIYAGGIGDGFASSSVINLNALNNIYAGGADDGFATILVTNQNRLETLPVTLLDFSGRWNNNQIELSWRTEDEINLHHFELERSVDNAGNFSRIATIAANGGPGIEQRYAFTDRDTRSGQEFFYRLRSVDRDGGFQYSAIIRFTANSMGTSLTIYPNPGPGLFTIRINGISDLGQYRYRILDNRGSLMAAGNITSAKTQFDITHLAAGYYFVQIIHRDKPETTYKIILQH